MKEKQDNLPRCAHYASKYLPLTENWIYRIVLNHTLYRPLFFARKKINLDLFPLQDLYSLDNFAKVRQYAEIFFFRLRGYFYFMAKISRKNSVEILHVH